MSGILVALAALVAVAVLGYVVGRIGVLRPQDEVVLSRVAFYVATPALMFRTISTADLGSIFSPILLTSVAGLVVVQAVFVLVARRFWHRPRGEVVLGALATSYVNAGNLGIPVGVYVLGDGALIAPILLFQLLVLAPTAFVLLDRGSTGWAVLRRPLRNPLTVASLLGLAFALTGVRLPEPVTRPIDLVGAAAVPLALLAYGLSLSGTTRVSGDAETRSVVLVVVLKCFAHPALAYLTGRYALGIDGTMLLAATLFAALPSAQNLYVFAVTYGTAKGLTRSAVLISTLVSIPVMAIVSGLLA
ncbi:hypothetical protein HNP84_000327 [Thermocatellispora tengchongensis]|uniref:AEC family transporter n=1 Tax=Thermocatellispora tengchongensis TaxID=1073253 RepID=A0A840NV06_9ACTN|nr:AEC family transporter [Thermocatellispora tengchongensis]MBB5130639.1 hypothetical protein [Thermocatellispora tengchongensis]